MDRQGHVGLFWFVTLGAVSEIAFHSVPLEQAELYGDRLGDPMGHVDWWAQLGANQAGDPRIALLAYVACEMDYDVYPRGRIVYDRTSGRFVVYADRQLHRPAFVTAIAKAFQLQPGSYDVAADEHYSNAVLVPAPRAAQSHPPGRDRS
jgi:hypothetical protein